MKQTMKRHASYDVASNDDSNDDLVTTVTPRKKICLKNRIGDYILGPKLNGTSQSPSIVQYLCRNERFNYFHILKILTSSLNRYDSKSLPGKMLLHNEYTILSLLQNDDGIVHHHGLFKEVNRINDELERTEKVCLVLDCYVRHEYDTSHYYTNLQHYIINQKCLNEREALTILYKLFKIIECIHNKNIVHRDLKLGNIVYDLQTQKVYLINFSMSRHLVDDTDLLTEQLGSSAYLSPEMLNSSSYYGKPNDIWSLGVVFYTLLFGCLPFYDPLTDVLLKKIQIADYAFPALFLYSFTFYKSQARVSDNTKGLLKRILNIDPMKRFSASQIADAIMSILASHTWKPLPLDTESLHIVPELKKDKKQADDYKSQLDLVSNLRNLTTNDVASRKQERATITTSTNTIGKRSSAKHMEIRK